MDLWWCSHSVKDQFKHIYHVTCEIKLKPQNSCGTNFVTVCEKNYLPVCFLLLY